MNDAIKIWGENYLNGDCGVSATSGTDTDHLYDQDATTKLTSSGSSEGATWTVTVTFKNWQGTEVSRSFDRVAIMNHNLKAITADYYTGGAWVSIGEMTLTLADDYSIIELSAAVEGTRFRINCTTTQDEAAEKYIGELKVCESVVSLGLALSNWQPAGDQKAGSFRLAGGPLVDWREYTKLSGTLSLENLSKTSKDTLLPYLKIKDFITLVFYSTWDNHEIYEFAVVNAPAWRIDRKAELFEQQLELRER